MTWVTTPHPTVDISKEISAAFADKPQLEKESRLAAIVATMKYGSYGELGSDGDDLGAIRADPEMFELRWHFGRSVYRLYYFEPAQFQDHLVACRFHRKMTEGSKKEIDDAQEVEISLGRLRFTAGQISNWGIST